MSIMIISNVLIPYNTIFYPYLNLTVGRPSMCTYEIWKKFFKPRESLPKTGLLLYLEALKNLEFDNFGKKNLEYEKF